MRWLEGTFPDKARGWVGFNVPMSHKITAACDLQLMPSRFEPCGLNQLYAMRYGAVPIAHETGGLKDTVLPFKPFDGRQTISMLGHVSAEKTSCDYVWLLCIACSVDVGSADGVSAA